MDFKNFYLKHFENEINPKLEHYGNWNTPQKIPSSPKYYINSLYTEYFHSFFVNLETVSNSEKLF
jgi:hypothetical protein